MNTRATGVRAMAGTVLAAAFALGAVGFVSGCAMDRASALRARAQGVEADLLVAQQRAMNMPPSERDAKLDQLETLREALAVTNMARDNAKNVPSGTARDALYSITEEAYGMIEWRMGMPPGPEDERLTKMNFRADSTGNLEAKLGDESKPRGIKGN